MEEHCAKLCVHIMDILFEGMYLIFKPFDCQPNKIFLGERTLQAVMKMRIEVKQLENMPFKPETPSAGGALCSVTYPTSCK